MKYILVQDNDCHWFVIPVENLEQWCNWCDSNEWVAPDFAHSVGGSPSLVEFENYDIK